jgi:hypothetical protein
VASKKRIVAHDMHPGASGALFSRDWWSHHEFSATATAFPADRIPPPDAYPDPVYLHVPGRGTALVSDAVDQAVAGTAIPARLDEEPYRLPEFLQASVPHVLPACNRGQLVFNGEVVGMRGDPLPPGRSAAPPVRLHVARFFDAQCSNGMCTLRITHRQTGTEFDSWRALLTNPDGRLNTLAESTLADCVGVSTIAITADGALVLARQSIRNTASALLLAPSGSGSLDPRDLGHGGTLQDIVKRGMERELCEETGIQPGEIRGTRVTGFARWLERGAKPEFFGITELSASTDDLAEHRQLASGERRYTDGTFTVSLLDALSLPAQIRDEGSLPLLLALRAAARPR